MNTHYGDWFPIELSTNVAAGDVVQAMLQGQELALWRSGAGHVQAWENRCPHRSVRLTLGFVADDQLVCRYHGWRYGPDGRCSGIPSTPKLAPPPGACVKSFPCREAGGVIWASLVRLPAGYPPPLADLAPCRSFTVDATLDELGACLARAGFRPIHPCVWREPGGAGLAATALLQPMDAQTAVLHLFVDRKLTDSEQLRYERHAAISRIRRSIPSRSGAGPTTPEARHA